MNLADIYSYIDSKKRAVGGLLSDPGGTLDKYVSQLREDRQAQTNLMSNAYPMAGDKTVLNSPHQLDQFRQQLADEGANMALTGVTSKLPFLKEAKAAYINGIPQKALDSHGNKWNVNVGSYLDGVRFERGGRVFGVDRNVSNQYYADPGHRDVANSIYALQNAKREARTLHAEVMRPTAAPPLPTWAKEITAHRNRNPAGPDWWNQTLKNKSNASFDAFAEAAKDTPLMLYGKGSVAQDPSIVAQAFPGISAKQSGGDLLFSGKNGNLMVFNADKSNPVIRSTGAASKGKADGGGKELYQAAYNWAGNNGKVVAPDTGITEINELRKLGNVLSAQIRSGKPVAELNSGGLLGEQGIPQIWKAEASMATKRAPEISSLKFDGSGFTLKDADVVDMLSRKNPDFSHGVGLMTAKRAALAKWLKTATPDQAKKAAAALVAAGSGAVFAGTKD